MFEEMTYENILNDMLLKVTNDVDKREGSIIYDALAPCAYQLAQNYFMLNNFIDLVSGDTAVGEYLDRVVADYGMKRKAAMNAIRVIETSNKVSLGTRWGYGDTSYVITEEITVNKYRANCEQIGVIGNQYSGALENIDNISGINATLTEILFYGQEEESDDNLRERFYTQLQAPSTSGNADNYIQWALEVPGVGDAKVFPLWNGNGTVKVLVINSHMEIDQALKAVVAEHIEKVRPIGVALTVDSPGGKEIHVSAEVSLDGSKSLEEVQKAFHRTISEYLKQMVFETYSVTYAKIGSLLLSTEGVADYANLLLNNDSMNVSIADTEMPLVGTLLLTEV